MGPYCNFCQTRCFTYLDITDLPAEMIAAYEKHRIDIIATCIKGQAAEKERIGYCYDDIQKARQEAETAARKQKVEYEIALREGGYYNCFPEKDK